MDNIILFANEYFICEVKKIIPQDIQYTNVHLIDMKTSVILYEKIPNIVAGAVCNNLNINLIYEVKENDKIYLGIGKNTIFIGTFIPDIIDSYLYDKILQIYTSDKNNTKSNIEYINLYKYVNMFICITKL
mgnify:CR=1 FL=1